MTISHKALEASLESILRSLLPLDFETTDASNERSSHKCGRLINDIEASHAREGDGSCSVFIRLA